MSEQRTDLGKDRVQTIDWTEREDLGEGSGSDSWRTQDVVVHCKGRSAVIKVENLTVTL